jgi:hypothetical protein
MPLWMFFDNSSGTAIYTNTLTSVSALNGKICWGMISSPVANGFTVVDFISEKIKKYTYAGAGTNHGNFLGNIADRNDPVGWDETYGTTEVPALSQDSVHDIAMTVLPNAPIDDATGLPIPTIAIGVGVAGSGGGGVNIIKDDGTVIDIIASAGAGGYVSYDVEFGSNNELIHTQAYNESYANVNIFDNIPSSDISATTAYTDARSYPYINSVPNIRGGVNGAPTPNLEYVSNSSGGDIAFGFQNTNAKLSLLSDNKTAGTDATKSMVAYITSDYNTGWMHGDIKGAFLSDTDATNVTGTELVTNGTFDSNVSGWTSGTNNTITWASGGYADVYRGGSTDVAYQIITTEIGKKYVISFDVISLPSNHAQMYVASVGGVGSLNVTVGYRTTTGTSIGVFTADDTQTRITLYAYPGVTVRYDNVSVRLAEEDRSVNGAYVNSTNSGKGLQVFGTVTKSAVATGAELVGYDNFSLSNYLVQPYNSDMQTGTGEFSCTAWFKTTSTEESYEGLIYYNRSGSIGYGWQIMIQPNSIGKGLYFYFYGASANIFTSTIGGLNDGNWHQVVVTHNNGTIKMFIDGTFRQSSSNPSAGSINDSQSKLHIGRWYGNANTSSYYWRGSIALVRHSASIPSDEQIKKIYEDEKVLFQENAAATLYGSSDAVTALAYDDSTNLLYAGTSSGRSDFQGLRRINNTTTAVTTAISASNGLVAEQ